jgi:MoaA/NifB/PqqE/SkfB family radical SAM enzyme
MFYNWGEPLLNKSLPRYIKKAHDYDIETEIHSNLSLSLSPHEIEDLLSSGLDTLTTSVDGFTQEAYQIHRVGGKIDLVKKNLEAFAETRERLGVKTRIVYKMLVFRHNEHEVEQAEQYCKDVGISFSREDAAVHDETWLPSYRQGEKPSEPKTKIPDLKTFLEFADWARDYFFEDELSNTWMPHSLKPDDFFPKFCSWHYGVSVVTGGGPVAPCCATAKERDDFGCVVPGQVRFADVWNNGHYRHARALASGQQQTATENIETLCDHCLFPRAIQHLYNIHDIRIMSAFYSEFKQKEPALEAGFQFLSSTRYGRIVQRLLRRGKLNLLLFLLSRNDNERNMSAYINFYETYLLDEPTPFDHQTGLPEVESQKIATDRLHL